MSEINHDHGFTLKRKGHHGQLYLTIFTSALAVLFAALWLVERGSTAEAAPGDGGTVIDRPLTVHFEPAMAGEESIITYANEHIAPDYGVELEAVGISDSIQANRAVADGEIDATIFEHQWYMKQVADANDFPLVPTTEIYQWGFGFYSDQHSSVDDLKQGAKVLVPNDPANQGQALWMMQREGFLELDPDVEPRTAKIADIVSNPHGWEIDEMDLLTMPRVLDSVDAAIGYISQFDAGKVDRSKGLLFPDPPRTFASRLIVAEDSVDSPATKVLQEIFGDPRMQEYLETTDDPLVQGILTPVSEE